MRRADKRQSMLRARRELKRARGTCEARGGIGCAWRGWNTCQRLVDRRDKHDTRGPCTRRVVLLRLPGWGELEVDQLGGGGGGVRVAVFWSVEVDGSPGLTSMLLRRLCVFDAALCGSERRVAEVRSLVAMNAAVNGRDDVGCTALHLAAGLGRAEVLLVLVHPNAGADKEANCAAGRTALHYAAVNGHVEAITVLVQAGADTDAKDATGRTPLHHAASEGHVEAIKAFVQLGANKEAKDNGWATPLHNAACVGNVEAIKALEQLGADKEANNAHGGTPLHQAALDGHVEAIKLLAELGARIYATTADRRTPLQCSVMMGHHQAAQLLRQLERAARTRKAPVTSDRTQQAARQDTPEARESAERMAAELIEEEERDQAECMLKAQQAAAQKEVRGVELAPVCGVSDAGCLERTGGWRVARCQLQRSCGGAESLCAWCARG
jgi:ankyrin repeat protein